MRQERGRARRKGKEWGKEGREGEGKRMEGRERREDEGRVENDKGGERRR